MIVNLTLMLEPFARTPMGGAMGFEGERKLATVLFVDLVNSTRLIAGKDPEDANESILPIIQHLIEVVNRFGGTVAQVLGDGILAVFGAPHAQEDHALRACLAAEQMISLTNKVIPTTASPRHLRYGLRVGINSGEIVAQEIESRNFRELRAVGETVYLAARLEKIGRPGSVLITEYTLSLTSGRVKARRIGHSSLAATSKPTAIYEVVEVEKKRRTALHSADDQEIELIGRAAELSVLRVALAGAVSGHGNTVVLIGDAGIGKSRIVSELLRSEHARSCRIIEHGILPFGQNTSLEPLACITRNLLALGQGIGAEEAYTIVTTKLRALGVKNNHAATAVLETCGFPITDTVWAGFDAPEKVNIAIETIAESALLSSEGRPLIILLEDFHWADSGIRLFAEVLASRISGSRVSLLVTSRSTQEQEWARWPNTKGHELGPLAKDDCLDFLNTLLGKSAALDDLKFLLVEKTQGNPFFLMECCRSLKDSGAIHQTAGGYTLSRPIGEIPIPASVHAVLAERIDNLSSADRDVLFTASTIGQNFDIDLLQGLLSADRKTLLARLARLKRMGFVERTRVIPNLEFGFRHALIHDVAYGTLLKGQRREIHARLCTLIKKRPSHELPGKIELLAHHSFLAGNWPSAFLYNHRAGKAAQRRSREREAVRLFRNTLRALDKLPQTRKNALRSTDVRLELVQSLFPIGEYEQVFFELQEAGRVVRMLGDERRLAEISSIRTLYHWISGSIPKAIQTGRVALRLAHKLGRRELRVPCLVRLGALLVDRGDYKLAAKFLRRVVEELSAEEASERFGLITASGVSARASLALALAALGQFQEAQKVGGEALGIANDLQHAFSQIFACVYVGNAFLSRGDFEPAASVLEQGLGLCRSMRSKLLLPWTASSLAHAYMKLGRLSKGLPLLEEAVEKANSQPLPLRLSLWLAWLAEACLAAGRKKESYSHAMDALRTAKLSGELGHEAHALWTLGEICAQSGHSAGKAKGYFDQASALARSCGMRPLLAHCHLSKGKLQRRFKQWDEAVREIETAQGYYKSLDMPYWLERADDILRETELA